MPHGDPVSARDELRATDAPAVTRSITRFAWLSIATATVTIALKALAYLLTHSVGLLSDALESCVNLVAAIIALLALRMAERPADEDHAFGRSKAEYFSSGAEGALILVAAIAILIPAVERVIHPRPLEGVGYGLAVAVAASVLHMVVARILLRAGRAHRSITLEADGHHLMTDVCTSAGVVLAVGLVAITGWQRLDPLVAIGVALNILRMGWTLMRRSASGLLDRALPREDVEQIKSVLDAFAPELVRWHALRTRQAGARRFIEVHILVPGAWTVERAHDVVERIEARVRALFPMSTFVTHLEPLEDERAWTDQGLDRHDAAATSEKA
jgi:cation diffusion facilitator family transporter